ncbi:MAG: hypothetical protein ACOH2T_28425 [Pseudomonas sp.]
MTELTPREWIDQANNLTGDDHDLADWYYVLLHSAEENCLRRAQSLDRLLDRKHWQVPKPAVTLLAWRNQLGNFKVAWEPKHDQLIGIEPERREFSLWLLQDLSRQRNELMSIKKPFAPHNRDERMDRAAAALCSAMASQFRLIAEELSASFDLTVAGHLKKVTEVKGYYTGLAASSAPYGGNRLHHS